MKILSVRFILLIGLLCGAVFSARAVTTDTTVYELRTYTAMPGKFEDVLKRFREHTLKIFEKHGMVNIGYFTPMDTADGAGEKLIYVLQHASREAATAAWKAFADDPEWKAVAKASETNGKIVAKTESVFMSLADFSPPIPATPNQETRVFELRTYTTPENGVSALDARFRDHTIELFKQHDITSLAYWHPLDPKKGAGTTLIYLLIHSSREAGKKNWEAFRADSKWVTVKADSEKQAGGSLTTKVQSVFLAPTDFSPLK